MITYVKHNQTNRKGDHTLKLKQRKLIKIQTANQVKRL